MMIQHYKSKREIEAIVRGFENCKTSKEAFTHREHLTVAVWYLYHSSDEEALDKMRSGLLRFLDHHQVAPGKYKEGLTVSWINLIKATMAEIDSQLSLVEITNRVLDQLGNSSLVSESSGTNG